MDPLRTLKTKIFLAPEDLKYQHGYHHLRPTVLGHNLRWVNSTPEATGRDAAVAAISNLAKVGVEGSNPSARYIFQQYNQ